MNGRCSRCGRAEKVAPLPKRFPCRTCADRLLCYTCDVTHNEWCNATPA